MQVVITDANIFIDLYEMDLLKGFFRLPYQVMTSIFVLEELDDIKASVEPQVTVLALSDKDLASISAMAWPRPFSFPDRSNLYLAQTQNMMVLSGEQLMMKWCKENKLEGHGLLYVLDVLITEGIYKPKYICSKLRKLMTTNLWLPIGLCEEMMRKWVVSDYKSLNERSISFFDHQVVIYIAAIFIMKRYITITIFLLQINSKGESYKMLYLM